MTHLAAQKLYARLDRAERLIARLACTLGNVIERVEELEAVESEKARKPGSEKVTKSATASGPLAWCKTSHPRRRTVAPLTARAPFHSAAALACAIAAADLRVAVGQRLQVSQ